jgi:hypothetical protein
MCLCPVLRSRPGPTALGLRSTQEATYCVQHGAVPPCANRKTQTISKLSRFHHAALTLAPYASCAPRGTRRNVRFRAAANLSRVGVIYPLGIINRFHPSFVGFLLFCLLARCAFLRLLPWSLGPWSFGLRRSCASLYRARPKTRCSPTPAASGPRPTSESLPA